MRARQCERIAWTLTLVLVIFWVWFGFASAISERMGWRNIVAHLLVPGGVFAALAVVARRWRMVGAAAMIAVGGTICAAYPMIFSQFYPTSTIVLVLLTTAAPLIAAGALLLEARHLRRLTTMGQAVL